MMKYKHAKTAGETQNATEDERALFSERPYLCITEMGVKNIDAKTEDLGLLGSPTKVKKIENVVFQAKESKRLTAADADIEELMVELIANHTLG
jgi:electron transfer flavoprotein beta subunit